MSGDLHGPIPHMDKLHEKAAEAYDSKLATLPNRLTNQPQRTTIAQVPPEKSDTHVMQTLEDGDINLDTYRETLVDYTGQRKACYFHTSAGVVGVAGKDHEILRTTVRRIAADPAYRDSLSEDFVYAECISWIKARSTAPDSTTPSFTDYLHASAIKAVKSYEVWLPIPVVQITNPFQIGDVMFRRITKGMMDEWAARSSVLSSPKAEATFDRLRSRIQAATASCVPVVAEPIRGDQLALERSDGAIAVLRLACPAIMSPHQWAPIDPSFIDRLGASILLRVEDKKVIGQHNSLHQRMLGQWLVNRQDIERNFRTIWGFGHNLLVVSRNEFQEVLLGALLHYSRSLLKSDTAERLLYIVTALESLFIKDPKENIVQNLRERMAALAGPSKAERLKLLKTVSRVYELRSAFVHRGVAVTDFPILEEFFSEAWTTLFFIWNNYNKWRTKPEFLRAVYEHKFSGPEFSTEGMPAV
jgi:hypothetical protein